MADPLARLAPSLRAACLRAAADAHARFAATQTQKQPAAHVLASSTIPLVEPLAIDVPWEGLRRSEGVDPQPMRSGRLVADQLLSAAEAARLATMVRIATSLLPEGSDGDVSVAPPLSLEAALGSGFADIPEVTSSVALLAAVTDRLKSIIVENFEVPFEDLIPAGVLASRLQPPRQQSILPEDSQGASSETKKDRPGYWNPHVDKANRCLYDFSAVLYLNNFGRDFQGGRFVFLDRAEKRSKLEDNLEKDISDGEDRRRDDGNEEMEVMRIAVEPRAGRLVAFSSGCENVHHVEPVKAGERLALSAWFTLGNGSVDAVPLMAN